MIVPIKEFDKFRIADVSVVLSVFEIAADCAVTVAMEWLNELERPVDCNVREAISPFVPIPRLYGSVEI